MPFDVKQEVLTEDEIVSEIERIVSQHGSYGIWIIGATSNPDGKPEGIAFTSNWCSWSTGDSEIAKSICTQFKAKGMQLLDPGRSPAAKYVYLF